MIAIIDYGVGNLFSLSASLKRIGAEAVVTSDRSVISRADSIILPGVGAFEDASDKLFSSGLAEAIYNETGSGKPMLGICLGMQLMLEISHEFGIHKGLGLIKGEVKPLSGYIPNELKIPHMGWNKLNIIRTDCPLFKYSSENDFVYFVHSYYCSAEEGVAAQADYGRPVTAAVWKDNLFGCQFHPEKSGDSGLKILKAFSKL